MLLLDAMLAWVHFMAIFGLVGCVFAEFFFYRDVIAGPAFARLQAVDRGYGILAGAVVVTGIARVMYSPKTAAYFMHNPIFWTKMSLFVAVGLLSIAPTMHLIRIARTAQSDGTVRIERATYTRMRALLTVQVVLLLLIPLCASLMAHGYR